MRYLRAKVHAAARQEADKASREAAAERDALRADVAAFVPRTAELARLHDAALAAADAYNADLAEYNRDVDALTRRGRAIAPHLPEGEVEAGTNGVGGGVRVGALGTAWVGVCRQSPLTAARAFFAFTQPEPPPPAALPVPPECVRQSDGTTFAKSPLRSGHAPQLARAPGDRVAVHRLRGRAARRLLPTAFRQPARRGISGDTAQEAHMQLEFRDSDGPIFVTDNRNGRRELRQVNTKQLAERERGRANQRLEELRAESDARRRRLRALGVDL